MFDLAAVGVTLNMVTAFAIGAAVGSFLNVCVYRIPYERSFLWPGSRCGTCYQPIAWYDNLPLLSYWLLRGRCRKCGARFSMRYFFVELATALAFLGLYYVEIYRNITAIPFLAEVRERWNIEHGMPSASAWAVFTFHATLMSFLIAASICDIDHLEIPLVLTVTGTVIGLIGSAYFAWPYPNVRPLPPPVPLALAGLGGEPRPPQPGLYPWPVWYPFPCGLPAGSWQLGLLTGLAGAAAGNAALRLVRFLFGLGRGFEGLGIGDSDLMMMAGAFVGWQVILLAFAAAIVPALLVGVGQMLFRGKQHLPFGPSLALGVMIALLGWPRIGPRVWIALSDAPTIVAFSVLSGVMLVVIAFVLRLVMGTEPPEAFDQAGG